MDIEIRTLKQIWDAASTRVTKEEARLKNLIARQSELKAKLPDLQKSVAKCRQTFEAASNERDVSCAKKALMAAQAAVDTEAAGLAEVNRILSRSGEYNHLEKLKAQEVEAKQKYLASQG